MRDAGAAAVAAALHDQVSLVSLDLGFNGIGDRGATALASALASNGTLRTLYLSGNVIGPAGSKALALALKSNDRTKLAVLHLTGNSLGEPRGEEGRG